MRTGATIISTAALSGVRAGLTTVLLAFADGTRAFGMCASILDCFRHKNLLHLFLICDSSMQTGFTKIEENKTMPLARVP